MKISRAYWISSVVFFKSSRQTSILTLKLEDLDYLNAYCFIDGRINTKIKNAKGIIYRRNPQ